MPPINLGSFMVGFLWLLACVMVAFKERDARALWFALPLLVVPIYQTLQ